MQRSIQGSTLKKLVLSLIVIILFSTQVLTAVDKHFGIFAGGNYFAKSERPGFKVYDNNPYGYGHFIIDDNGFSFHAGIIGYINDKFSIEAKYRFPRFTSYVYAATITPYVYGPNTYFTESMTTSWTAAIRFHLNKINIFEPYIGLGLDLFRVEAYHSVGFIHPVTYVISYIFPEDYLGVKNILGVMIPFGTTISISKRFLIDVNMNYTIMRLPEWSEEFYLADDQNFGGFYINLNLVYKVW